MKEKIELVTRQKAGNAPLILEEGVDTWCSRGQLSSWQPLAASAMIAVPVFADPKFYRPKLTPGIWLKAVIFDLPVPRVTESQPQG